MDASKRRFIKQSARLLAASGKARIRTQMSAAHTIEELDFAVDQFIAARDEVGA